MHGTTNIRFALHVPQNIESDQKDAASIMEARNSRTYEGLGIFTDGRALRRGNRPFEVRVVLVVNIDKSPPVLPATPEFTINLSSRKYS